MGKKSFEMVDLHVNDTKHVFNAKYLPLKLEVWQAGRNKMIVGSHLCLSSAQEPMDVVELFGLKGVQHTPISIKNARVSQVNDL